MKANISEGIYRIFVTLSFISVFVTIMFSVGQFDYAWQCIFLAVFVGCSVYFLYFLIEWVAVGFIQDEGEYQGARKFIKNIFHKLSEKNYCAVFYLCLMILFFMAFMSFAETKKFVNMQNDVKKYNSEYIRLDSAYTETNSELNMCKSKLKSVLQHKTEKELMEDVDAYYAKDYIPD